MKKHLVNIRFDPPGSYGYYNFTGYVYGNTISAGRLFQKAFGFELPTGTTITIN